MKRRRPGSAKSKARGVASTRLSGTAPKDKAAALARERDEALQQQAATAEILRVISTSPADTQPIFDAIVQSALKLFPDALISLALRYGDTINAAAVADRDPERVEAWRRSISRTPLSREYMHGAALLDCRVVDVPDAKNAPAEFAAGARNFLTSGNRAVTITPMTRRNEAIGLLTVVRRTPGPLSDKQFSLLRTFAAQAVIAIENTRVLNELRESLQQQTATADVLKVISASPGDMKPVFKAMLTNALRLCEAKFGHLLLYDGERFHGTYLHDVPPAYREFWEKHGPIRPAPNTGLGRIVRHKRMFHIPDLKADVAYAARTPLRVITVEEAGARSFVGVPMLKDGKLVGAIVIYRQEVRPFTERQIELLQNFAAQAVIAIENTRLLNELRESLQQQTATADVLKVISSSPGDLEPVFNAMLANATRLCNAEFGTLNLYDGDVFHIEAVYNVPSAFAEARLHEVFRPHPGGGHTLVLSTKDVVQIEDIRKGQAYLDGDPAVVAISDLGGARTIALVPMLKDDALVGTIAIYRKEVLPFTEKQIELVKNFAAQAVIAIENTRLLSELRESLQQQTATADVLKVISSSPGELEPVFQAMLEKTMQLCEAKFGIMFRFADGIFRATSWQGNPPAHIIEQPHVVSENPHNLLTRIVHTKQPVHSADLAKERAYIEGNPRYRALVDTVGARSLLVVPMLKNEELIGAIAVYWQEARTFTDKQMELISNFAAQAVIAIDNARLLNELRESLQQQTATADVLKVISSSTGELQPVFEAILENAVRICEAGFGNLWLHDGKDLQAAAIHGASPEYRDLLQREIKVRPGAGTPIAGVIKTKRPTQMVDLAESEAYRRGDPVVVASVEIAGTRSLVAVPMLKDGELVGAIAIYRREVRPFTDKQIELVSNFAAQAVIAIENTRLLNELRESLQQQTATADVLKVISRSTFDLGTVLQTLVESASTLCDADRTVITRQKNGIFYRAETHGFSSEFIDHVRDVPISVERGSAFGRALLERRAVHIPDVKADPEYAMHEMQKLGDYRTVLSVPMLREGVAIGALSLTRSEVRPFTDRQIELASTFADQAAIAIENVRLFENVEARTRELAASLEDLRATQDRLVQTQKLASLGQLTAGIAHEIKNPLNFVNNFSAVSSELIDELQDTLKSLPVEEKTRKQIDEVTAMLRGNLDKVVQHGKRADSIVKNMLLHSREGSGEHRLVDINALVEESLNLAYHGARAEKQNFNITLERSLDPGTGEADVFPQDITRVLLNLISNGFYAAVRRKARDGDGFEPVLAAATRSLGDRVEIRIRDNGTGIPSEVREKIFNPFFTTKPAGEGTGLGLSISHDIVVKQHAGAIEIDTEPGAFTEIRIILPRKGAFPG